MRMRDLADILVGVMLLFHSVTDCRYRKIWWPAAAVFSAAGLAVSALQTPGELGSAAAGLSLGLLFWLLSKVTKEAVGSGDAFVIGSCGAWIGPEGCLELVFLSLLGAFFWALILVIVCKAEKKKRFAFVPFLFGAQVCRILMK